MFRIIVILALFLFPLSSPSNNTTTPPLLPKPTSRSGSRPVVSDIPYHGEPCNNETWSNHIELLYQRDRRSIEGFNSFLKAVAERDDMEKKLVASNISTKNLCDFGKAEVLFCDPQNATCQCGGKWQKLETKLMVINGKWECRANLFTKCRNVAESPFKQFKGWSPCEPGAICKVSKSKDVIRQATPKYGTCVCDDDTYNGEQKSKRNPIQQCACALVPCQAHWTVPFGSLITLLLGIIFAIIAWN